MRLDLNLHDVTLRAFDSFTGVGLHVVGEEDGASVGLFMSLTNAEALLGSLAKVIATVRRQREAKANPVDVDAIVASVT